MDDGPDLPRRYRVVQWGTGNIGRHSLGAVIDHPAFELVGVYAYSEDKIGRDAGEICGRAATGVVATGDVDEIIGLRPDCVLYMGNRADVDVLSRLLSSGINVVSTRGEFHRPASMDPDARRRIEEACRQGRASLHSTGSSPGFVTEALPIVLTSLERRLDRLLIDEFADISSRDSPDLVFRLMGFGSDPERFDSRRWSHGASGFGPSLSLLAETLGLALDGVEATGEVAVARRTVEVAAGTLQAGTVAAQRMIVTGHRGGEPVIWFQANWYLTTELEPAWELQDTGWRVRVEGDTPLDVRIGFPIPPEDYAATSPGFTAHRAVNAVPLVCAAPPGIRTTADLPQVIAMLGR